MVQLDPFQGAAMAIVGVTEELPAFVAELERRVAGSPGPPLEPDNASPPALVAGRRQAYDDAARQRLAELNPLDLELHAFAGQLWESRYSRHPQGKPQTIRG